MKPGKLNILGVVYEVRYKEDLLGENEAWGQHHAQDRLIEIQDTPDDFQRWHITWHEVIHAISDSLGLAFNDEKHHKDLDRLALGITDVLIRNKLMKE